jgi:predicted dehydrogenase
MKIGVVGTGTMGKLHLDAWSNMKAVTISGILGRDKSLVDQLAEKYISNTYTEYEELLNTDIDVIDICLPTYLHKEFVTKAAQHGKHIICEKPLALNLDDCRAILEICHTYGVQLFVGHTLRFSPEYKHAHDQVKSGVIGEPGVVRLSRGGPYPLGRDSWYQDEVKSGGVILDLGIHEFDWVRWTFGEVERVMAKQVKRKGENGNSIEYALVTLRMLSGTIVHIELSWAKETFESAFEIAGNKGMLTHSDRESYPIKLKIKNEEEQNSGGVALPKSIGTNSPLQLQLEHFTKCLENDEKPIISVEDAMKAVEIALAAIESVNSGQPVSLLTKKEVF